MWIENIDFTNENTKYMEIYNNIKKAIDSGEIEDGEKLPAIRALSEKLAVNKITIINAYKKLEQEGYAFQKIGSGSFARKKEIVFDFKKEYSKTFKMLERKKTDFIDFTGETNKEVLFPIRDFKEIINKVLDRDGEEVLVTQDPLGYEPLRKTINKVFFENTLNNNNIIVVSGAQQGIDIASKAMLNINDTVVVEKPTYGGALSVFRWKKSRVLEIKLDEDGLCTKELEKKIKKNRVKLLYVMSYFQNPTGISYSLEKKKKILELAKKYDFYIIEDDYLSELIYEKSLEYIPFKKLDKDDRVIYIKSFSKIFLPGIRLGYIVAPSNFREVFLKAKFNTDIATSSLMQRALEYYIGKWDWKENIRKLSEEYKKRYTIMNEEIDKSLSEFVVYRKPKGGLNFYIQFKNEKVSSIDLFLRLKEKNIFITPGVFFFKNKKEGEKCFRLGFSQVDAEKIRVGIKNIKEEINGLYND